MPSHWIVKTEPSTYSYDDLHRDGQTVWDGVRNNLALKHIRSMAQGDEVLVYHSGADKALVGLAVVAADSYADPKAKDEKLAVVDLRAVKPLPRSVTLAQIKADGGFNELALVRMPRLSVMPVPVGLWKRLLKMAGV